MPGSQWFFKFNKSARTLVACFLVVGLLGGCTKPFVNVEVEVDSCQAGQGKPIKDGQPQGFCNSDGGYTGTIKPAGYEVCKNVTGAVIACTGNEWQLRVHGLLLIGLCTGVVG